MKKVALIGSTGQLGSALLEELGGENVFPFSHQQIEIGDLKTTANVLVDYAPQIIINTAAFHNVLACERDPDQSFLINCTAVKNLAHVAARIGSVFVHVSTDYVFGLKQDRNMPYMETDSPGPVNVYGLSKLAGEYASLYTNNRTFIFRSSGLYGLQGASSKGGNFVDKRILDAETQTEIPMSREQKLTPTFTRPLAKSMVSLIFSKNRTTVSITPAAGGSVPGRNSPLRSMSFWAKRST